MNLKDYLKENNFSRSEFASKCGLSLYTLDNILMGRSTTLINSLKIQQATEGQVKPIDLLGDKVLRKSGIDKKLFK